MISTKLPYGSPLSSMTYNSKIEVLVICFKKGNSIQQRSYKCNIEIGYNLFYCKSATQVLECFNEKIKGKLEVLTVK